MDYPSKIGIAIQTSLRRVMNTNIPVEPRLSRKVRLLVASVVATLLVQIGGISFLQIRPVAAVAGPGSLVVTSNYRDYSPCGGANNFVDVTLPAGSAIDGSSPYTVEAWVKLDSATNTVGDLHCSQIAMSNTRYGLTEIWNQRSGRNASGGSFYLKQSGVTYARCDGSDPPASCPKVEIPVGAWTHLALQRSVVGGVIRLTVFINGRIVVSRNNLPTTVNGLRYILLGGFGNNMTGSKVSFGQIRVSSGAIYPSDGSTTFAPTYDFSNTVAGGTVLALFQPQSNSTIASLNTNSFNGATIANYGTTAVAASSDYATPPPPAFSYSSSSVTTTAGIAIAANNVVSTGGDINSFAISPALPNGLTLNPTTGSISGTPTVHSPTTSYVVTGTQNSSGLTSTATVSITINKPTTSISIALDTSTVQVGVVNTITATTSVAGTVSFQTDQGVIPGCSSISTTVLSSFTASCPWTPTSVYFTMNATLTPVSNDLAPSTSTPSLTNIRGSLSLTSTGAHVYPDGSGSLATNNSVLFTFPENEGLNASRSFAIETWVKVAGPTLNMKMGASFGNSFYPDRGEGFTLDQGGTRVVPFVNGSFVGYKTISAVSAGTWQNVVFQRTIVLNQPNQSFDSIFINGQLISQYGNGLSGASGGKAQSIKIGPFVGVTQIGPTQVLTNTAPYPVSGFAPSTTYSFGSNTMALFQPSATACGSSVMAPATVTVSYQTTNTSCSTDFPVAAPSINSVESNRGPISGGNRVVITGNNFVGVTGVSFGTTAVNISNYSINSFGTQITATAPAGAVGTVDVKITTPAGSSSVVAADKYSYVPAPTVSALSRTTGATGGGTAVVITGTNFTDASAVTFGGSDAAYFNVNSSTQITAVSPAGTAGVVDIRVTTPGGTSAIVGTGQFTYTSSVTVVEISPTTGSTTGGTGVVITGTNFTDVSAVMFGSVSATSFTVNSTSSIVAVSPAGSAGVVDVRVVAAGGTSAIVTSDRFTYTSAVTVVEVSPSVGSTDGGTTVVITGTNFTDVSAVLFGSVGAASFTVNSSTRITAVSPAGSAGVVDVRVTAAGGTSGIVAADQFSYYTPPSITSMSASVGLTTGGTSVVITGTNFTNVSAVMFGSISATSFTVNSSTRITAVSPAGSAGVVDVRVTGPGGTSVVVAAGQFTYYGLPTVSEIGPASGPISGATSVVITGTNFTGATAVMFGATNAASFSVDSPTQITAISPARSAGSVNVQVVNPAGLSEISLFSLYGQFTYLSPPTVSAISLNSGSITGGSTITITGSNLDNLLATGGVKFGSIDAQSVLLIDPTHIQVVSPATSVTGDVHITLTNTSGTSTPTSADLFTYTRSDDANLSGLSISTGVLSPAFTSGNLAYSVNNARDGLTVTPTTRRSDSTVQIKVGSGSFASVVSGTASLPLSLALGSNTITVRVTADDGTTTKNYTITATRLSSDATLSVASVKGSVASLGASSESIGSESAGSVTLTTAQASGAAITTFTKTQSGAVITKIVKFASGTSENSANFSTAPEFTNGAATQVSDGDFFVVQVTAADGTVNYTRINVVVQSNIATLSSVSIKGQNATVGTASSTIGSEVAGSVTLTTAGSLGSLTSLLSASNSGAVITKIVRFSSGSTENVLTFAGAATFANGSSTQVSNGDFFVVQVTAADGTVNYTRINVVVLSNIATLSSVSIKGQNATVGTASSTIGPEIAGSVILTTAQASGSSTSTFTKTDSGAGVSKIVKYLTGSVANEANFGAATSLANGSSIQVSNGDFFVVQVTAADGTVNYTRINVVFAVSPSAPQNVSAAGQQGGASLIWGTPVSDGGSAITGYLIEKSTDSVNWTTVGTTNQDARSFIVSGLSDGTTYSYRVSATNSSGDGTLNFATTSATTTDYFVSCSISGSFYVRGTTIPSAAGQSCVGVATIPQGIVGVAINAFAPGSAATSTNRLLTGLVFPQSGFTNIDQGGFRNLGLASVTIPASVTMVGQAAFENNPLTSVFVHGGRGGSSTYLSQGSFNNQDVSFGLSTSIALTLGEGKIDLGWNFGSSTRFSTVDFGSGLFSIDDAAFKQNGIASGWVPLFPSTITSIGRDAFANSPNLTTIRFGSSTTSSITSIHDNAFDSTVTSIQYCGPRGTLANGGTILSDYFARRLPNAYIWCSTSVPNAPTNLTASASSGEVALNWLRGATGSEAPTTDFLIQYSSNSGAEWTSHQHTASTSTSITIPNLSNGTTYLFRVAAVNLFGASAYSANVSARPLGLAYSPSFDTAVSTSDGFTVNITNYDETFMFNSATVTAGTASVSIGNPVNGKLPVTVSGMSPGSPATIRIKSSKNGFVDGFGYASGTSLLAPRTPEIDTVVTKTGGLTARITNYDEAFAWSVTASSGSAAINEFGGVLVTGVLPSTQVTVTVRTARTGYTQGSHSFAVTTLQKFRVQYNGNGATGGAVPTDASLYSSDDVAVVQGNPNQNPLTLLGNSFSGWTLNPNGTGPVYLSGSSLQLASSGVTLYAKWTLNQYSLTYRPNCVCQGAVPDPSTYEYGDTASISGNSGTLVRAGYSFVGWGINPTNTGTLYRSGDSFTIGANDVELWARWSPNTYTVRFDANGAIGSASKTTDAYTTASSPVSLATVGSLEKTGYHFSGWGLSAVSAAVSDSYTVATDTTLYAQWRVNSYAVTYLAGTNGLGTLPTQASVNFGELFTVASSGGLTANDGQFDYAFVAWSDGVNTYAGGQSYLMDASPVTLTAQWTRIYNVRYSFNGGSVATSIPDEQKISGDVITISSEIPTRDGYEFMNWKDQSGLVVDDGDAYTVSDGHYLLYAQWRAISYRITYDVNGGSAVSGEQNHEVGDIFTVAAAPTKTGYTFSKWSDGAHDFNAGSTYQVGTTDVVLTAIWAPKEYLISFDFNGGIGTPIDPIRHVFNTPAASLPMTGLSREDFTFSGWSASSTATTGTSTFSPSGNILLFAVWVPSVYLLTFEPGSGLSDVSSAKVTIGQAIRLPSATRANYTLLGWSTQQDGGPLLAAGDLYTPTACVTLYAQWTLQEFTVTYNGVGGTASRATDRRNYGSQTPIVLPTASRSNYVFTGWYSSPSGGYLIGTAGANLLLTNSMTVYAHWVQKSLYGLGAVTQIAQITVRAGYDASFTAGSNGSTATLNYAADSLPDGTVITAYMENSIDRVVPLLSNQAKPILSLVVSWVALDGTVPTTVDGRPIVVTIANPSIMAGSVVYGILGNELRPLGTSVVDGQVQVAITEDPAVVVAMTTAAAPTAVVATSVDAASALISWSAPTNNGGSAITRYVATSSNGQSCSSLATSCVVSGLSSNVDYTFTVVANNEVGSSQASRPSAVLRLIAPMSSTASTTIPLNNTPVTSVVATEPSVPDSTNEEVVSGGEEATTEENAEKPQPEKASPQEISGSGKSSSKPVVLFLLCLGLIALVVLQLFRQRKTVRA